MSAGISKTFRAPLNSTLKIQAIPRSKYGLMPPGVWTGVEQRDDHLRSADFLDAENHPEITFKGNQVEVKGEHDFAVTGDLTIRGVTHSAILNVSYLGQWERQGTEDARGFSRCHADQSPGLWRQLARYDGPRRDCRG